MTINTNNYTYSFIFDEFGTSNAVLYVTKMPIDGNVATDSNLGSTGILQRSWIRVRTS